MNLIFLLFVIILAAIWHQPLYILIPVLSLLFTYRKEKFSLVLHPFTKLYLGMFIVVLLFLLIQSLFSLQLDVFSIKGTGRYLSYALFACLVFSFKVHTIRNYFRILIIYFVLTSPWAFFQMDTLGRYQNFFSHANHLAYVIVICIYFLIAYNPFKRILNYIFLGVLLASLFLTKTSGAILILLALAVYNFIISRRISFKKKLIILLGPILILLPIALNFSDKIFLQLESLNYLQWDFLMERVREFKPGGYGSFIWRIVYWLKIYFSFLNESNFNFIFGIGIDSLTKGNMPYEYMYTDPHNDFLKVLVEFGFIGLLLFLYFLIRIYYIGNKQFNFLIIILIPLFFDNAIVNFSFNLSFILLLCYENRRKLA